MSLLLEILESGKMKSPIHKLNPRVKLVWWIVMIILPILITHYVYTIPLVLLSWVLAVVAKVHKSLGRYLLVTYPALLGFIILTWPFFYDKGGRVIFTLIPKWVPLIGGKGAYTVEGLIYGTAMALRIAVAVTASMFFVLCTDMIDLANCIGEDFQRLGGSYKYPYMVVSSFRFLPSFVGTFGTIKEAYLSRAVALDKGGIIEKGRKYITLFVPLIDTSLKSAYDMTIAMELKAFGAVPKRTFYKTFKMSAGDYLFLAFSILLLIAGIYLRITGKGVLPL